MNDSLTENLRLLPLKFRNYYLACRNEGGAIHALGSTSRWRAFKFAAAMSWWWLWEVK